MLETRSSSSTAGQERQDPCMCKAWFRQSGSVLNEVIVAYSLLTEWNFIFLCSAFILYFKSNL